MPVLLAPLLWQATSVKGPVLQSATVNTRTMPAALPVRVSVTRPLVGVISNHTSCGLVAAEQAEPAVPGWVLVVPPTFELETGCSGALGSVTVTGTAPQGSSLTGTAGAVSVWKQNGPAKELLPGPLRQLCRT